MLVRELSKADRQLFFELCKEFYQSNATIRSYDEEITEKTFYRVLDKHENLWGYILNDNDSGEVVGYALITSYWSNEDGGNVIVLDELYINTINRHKGYGKLFMRWIENHFSDAVSITLEVLTSNQKASELYTKSGYMPDGYTTYTKPLKKKQE